MIAVVICLLIAINVNGQTCPSDAISTLVTGDRDLSTPLTSPACLSCAYIAGGALRYFTDVTWTRRRSGVINTLLINGTGGVLIGPSTDTPDPTNTLVLNDPSVVIAVGDEIRCDSNQARAAGHSTGEHIITITIFRFLNPLISPINGTIDIAEGSNLTLNCDDPGNTGSTSYQWFNVTGTELSNRETTPPAVLTFNNIQRTSSGVYICRSSKTIGIKDSNVTINVQYDICIQDVPCQNGGTCTLLSEPDNYTCTCSPGYTSENCTININECDPNPCQNGGFCFDRINDYTCNCVAGYTDKNCSTNINECNPNPCENGGTCVDGINNYTCICIAGYTDINCSRFSSDVNGQTCPSDAISTLATGDRDLDIPLTSPACFSCGYIVGGALRYFTDVTWTRIRSGVNDTLLTNGTGGVLIVPSADTPDPTNTLVLNDPSVVIAVGDELRCDSAQARAAGHATGVHLITITAFRFLNPLILPINGTINIVEGSNLTLNCDDPGNTGGTSYQWFNVTGTELSNRFTTPPAVLTFNNIQRPSSGVYICRSSKTNIGIKESNVTINVQYDICIRDVPCQNGGTCTLLSEPDNYTCTCSPGYTGENCTININECNPNPCQNGGFCFDRINDYTCNCVAGYTDKNCSTNINECNPNPCENGGTCVDGINNYTCICIAGYTDINCSRFSSDVNGQTCPSDAISTLATGDRNLDIPLTSSACFSCGYIVGGALRYFTDVTWTRRRINTTTLLTNGTGGVLIGPSTDTPDPTNTLVLNDPSVVIAVGDEVRCDSAQARAAGHATGVHLITITAFRFLNPLILPINGTINIVEGSDLTLNCDDPGNSGFTSYQWFNVTGTELSNRFTTPPAVLTFNNIQRPSSGVYICRSSKTNIGIKESNVTINVQHDICIRDVPCQNGGTCTLLSEPDNYTCTCAPGYTGENCTININECDPNPCQNGGFCFDRINDYTCNCVAGYTDKNCSTDINECNPNPCENGGTCVDGINNYTCICIAGYTDKNCSTNINECDPNPCQNGGFCFDRINDYTCNCVVGYTDKNCSLFSSGPSAPSITLNYNSTTLKLTCTANFSNGYQWTDLSTGNVVSNDSIFYTTIGSNKRDYQCTAYNELASKTAVIKGCNPTICAAKDLYLMCQAYIGWSLPLPPQCFQYH